MFSVIFLPQYVSCAPASVLSLQNTQTGARSFVRTSPYFPAFCLWKSCKQISMRSSAVNEKGRSPRNMFPSVCRPAFFVKLVC